MAGIKYVQKDSECNVQANKKSLEKSLKRQPPEEGGSVSIVVARGWVHPGELDT